MRFFQTSKVILGRRQELGIAPFLSREAWAMLAWADVIVWSFPCIDHLCLRHSLDHACRSRPSVMRLIMDFTTNV